MGDRMKKWIFVILTLLCIYLLIQCNKTNEIFGTDNSLMTKAFVGTYSDGNRHPSYIIADPETENIFYYCNAISNIYLKGSFEKNTEIEYTLTGDEIESQTIMIENQKFTFLFEGREIIFQKISEIPTYPAELEEMVK